MALGDLFKEFIEKNELAKQFCDFISVKIEEIGAKIEEYQRDFSNLVETKKEAEKFLDGIAGKGDESAEPAVTEAKADVVVENNNLKGDNMEEETVVVEEVAAPVETVVTEEVKTEETAAPVEAVVVDEVKTEETAAPVEAVVTEEVKTEGAAPVEAVVVDEVKTEETAAPVETVVTEEVKTEDAAPVETVVEEVPVLGEVAGGGEL